MLVNIPTPHIEVDKKGVIADVVLMPGDPLRAKYIAETYLENPVLFNGVRGMNGYTGHYEGHKISVMGSGMGMPSMGIYAYELFKFYDVKTIVRIGSCGAYTETLDLYDVIVAKEAWSESTYAKVQSGYEKDSIEATKAPTDAIIQIAEDLNIPVHQGRIHSTDVFYRENFYDFEKIRDNHGCIAAEMEAFSLFATAKFLNKQAACLLTVSDSMVRGDQTTSEERQKAFTRMMEIALRLPQKLG